MIKHDKELLIAICSDSSGDRWLGVEEMAKEYHQVMVERAVEYDVEAIQEKLVKLRSPDRYLYPEFSIDAYGWSFKIPTDTGHGGARGMDIKKGTTQAELEDYLDTLT